VQVDQPIPTNEQFSALLEAALKTEAGLQLATWIIFRGYTGTRPTESFYMEWRDIDFANGLVMVRPKEGNPLKNRKARAIPMHSELRTALLQWRSAWEELFAGRRKPPHDWVFVTPRHPERRCQRFEKTYPRAQRLAGLTVHMTSHCLRHFFISRAVEAGVNFLAIANWVGHSSTKMIEQVYAHLSPQFKEGEMKKLQLGLGGGNGNAGAVVSEKSVDSGAV
ncbi:MAG: site-specific integrase, partial [Verrucomicrobia bacterium]|nr:site-specific integrase [Verrucomicrobiota bacterium]